MQGKLTFTNTVERFDAGDCDGGVVEVLEAEHGTGSGLDIPMILFDQIVQVFRRSQFGALPCLVFVWNFTHCSMRSGIAIKRDADRCAQFATELKLPMASLNLWRRSLDTACRRPLLQTWRAAENRSN